MTARIGFVVALPAGAAAGAARGASPTAVEPTADAGSASTTTMESPIHFPGSLPPDGGERSLSVSSTDAGYVLVATIGDATYRIAVTASSTGLVEVPDSEISASRKQPAIDADGSIHWADAFGTVDISAVNAPHSAAAAASIIAEGMIVTPRAVFEEFADDPNALHSLELEPIQFPGTDVSLAQSLNGRLGDAKVEVVAPGLTTFVPFCVGCDTPFFRAGWKHGATIFDVELVPASAKAEPPDGVALARTFAPMIGSSVWLVTGPPGARVPVSWSERAGPDHAVWVLDELHV